MNELPFSSGLNGRVLLRQEWVFWATAAVLLLIFLWTPGLQGNEADFAESAREMAAGNSWLTPELNWQWLQGHPPMGFWSAAVMIKLLGSSEFAVRLPGALAALGALYALRSLGRTLFNEKIAAVSCWFFLGSAGFLMWGRSASAEMFNTMVVLTAAAWFLKMEKVRSFSGYFLFYLLCFGGAFLKGESAFIMPFLILLPCIFTSEEGKKHLNRRHAAAFGAGAGLYVLFLYTVYYFSTSSGPEGFFTRELLSETLLRFRQLAGLKNNWANCGKTLLEYLLPWIFILPVGIAGFLKDRQHFSGKARRIFAGVCCTFCFYALFNAEAPESMLALVPFVLLYSAAGFAGSKMIRWNAVTFTASYYVCIAAASLYICSAITYPLWEKIADCTPPVALVLGPVIAGLLAWFVLFMDHTANSSVTRIFGLPHKLSSLLFSGTILSGCIFSVILPEAYREYSTRKGFFQEFHKAVLKSSGGNRSELPVVSFALKVPSEYLFCNDIQMAVPRMDDLETLTEKFPGQQMVFLMKKQKGVLEQFNSQCRLYGMKSTSVFFSEEISRWGAPDSRSDNFVSYLVTVPGKKQTDTAEAKSSKATAAAVSFSRENNDRERTTR